MSASGETPASSERLRELSDALIGLEAAEREGRLAEECRGEPALRRQLEALFAADRRDEGHRGVIATGNRGRARRGIHSWRSPSRRANPCSATGSAFPRRRGDGWRATRVASSWCTIGTGPYSMSAGERARTRHRSVVRSITAVDERSARGRGVDGRGRAIVVRLRHRC